MFIYAYSEDENERFCKENKELKLELDQQRADEVRTLTKLLS
jgi:hypothetical protein